MNNYKTLVAQDFSKAAQTYNQYAILQKLVVQKLIADHRNIIEKANYIIDIGCGTGFIGSELKQLYPQKQIIQTDIATKMAISAHQSNTLPTIISDMENLPLINNIDMVISSLAIQWGNLNKTLLSIKKTLKNHGYILISTITNKSFYEIKTINPNIYFEPALSYNEIQKICIQSDIDNLNANTYIINQTYPSIKDIFLMFKYIGARKKNNTNHSYLGKNFFTDMEQKYQTLFPNKKTYSMSWEIAIIKNF